MPTFSRRSVVVGASAIVALVLTGSVLAAPPATSPGQGKASKGPEVPVSVRGTVVNGSDTDGKPTFSVVAGGKTWVLSAGPSWYWGDKNPLAAFVGKTVAIVGTSHEGDTELDVDTVDGAALREPGKPDWAGGPWAVGSAHPGWKSWMADGKRGKGPEQAPGQLKKESAAP